MHIAQWLNIFIVFKVKFSVTSDVLLTVIDPLSEMTQLCMDDATLRYFF